MSRKRKIWSEERIIEDLRILADILKRFPTQQDLVKHKRLDLQSAIGRISRKEGKNYP